MIYLYDTNVVSETAKKAPNKKLIDWLLPIDIRQAAISVLTIGEIRKGLVKLQDGSKKQAITWWLEMDIMERFDGRIISVDSIIAEKWGYITSCIAISPIDGLIAASCLVHNLKLVTRNIKDFEKIPSLEIVNPWEL